MDNCAVGYALKELCHLDDLTNDVSLLTLNDISKKDCIDILERTGVEDQPSTTVCSHHKIKYTKEYQRCVDSCCNPFKLDKHKRKKKSKAVSEKMCKDLQQKGISQDLKDIKVGFGLCTNCYFKINQHIKSVDSQPCSSSLSSDEDDSNSFLLNIARQRKINELNIKMQNEDAGISPIKLKGISQQRKSAGLKTVKRKIDQISSSMEGRRKSLQKDLKKFCAWIMM